MSVPLSVLLVDPSLFTGPYDFELGEGLKAAGVRPVWAVRPLRSDEADKPPRRDVVLTFYRRSEAIDSPRLRALAKGVSHLTGLARLVVHIIRTRPSVVHVQWAVVPLADALAMSIIRLVCPVVMTVHDPVPFNGQTISFAQNAGFYLPLSVADRIIVHTDRGRNHLVEKGVDPEKIAVIAHGPLSHDTPPTPRIDRDPRWTVVLFGMVKPYKGLDILIEALGLIAPEVRGHLRVVVAGAPAMDMTEIFARVAALGLDDVVEFRLQRLDDQELADLLDEADGFVFPYRQIDASGVYFLVSGLGKWMIASRIGVFEQSICDGQDGRLVPPEDPGALARALTEAATLRPALNPLVEENGWISIGQATRALYETVIR